MKFIFYLFIFCFAGNINSQTTQKIKFQKNASAIYFFPKNPVADSVIERTNVLFYFIVPDSLKRSVIILVENGQFVKAANDSLIRLNYMPGLKYESQFVISETTTAGAKELKKEFNLISLINGASSYKKNKILIQVVNKKEDKVLMENVFYFK